MKNTSISVQNMEPFFQKIGQLTKLQRIFISLGAAVVVIAVFGYFLYLPKYDRISELRENIKSSEQKLEQTKRKADAYEAVKKEYDNQRAKFNIMARALPDKDEIPSLLTGISQAGKASGLKFLLFQPQGESKKDFYSEIPVRMELEGGYHDLGVFFDKLARLSRVVNVKDFSITQESGNSPRQLRIACTAVTYRFTEQPENKKQKKK